MDINKEIYIKLVICSINQMVICLYGLFHSYVNLLISLILKQLFFSYFLFKKSQAMFTNKVDCHLFYFVSPDSVFVCE